MTTVQFFHQHQWISGFEINGHSSDHAEDLQGKLVCAAVSSAAYLVANTLIEVLKSDVASHVSEQLMTIRVLNPESAECQAVLKGFQLHLDALSKQYTQKITIKKVIQSC